MSGSGVFWGGRMIGRQVRVVFAVAFSDYGPAVAFATKVVGERHSAFALFGFEYHLSDCRIPFDPNLFDCEVHLVHVEAGVAFEIGSNGGFRGGLHLRSLGGFGITRRLPAAGQAEQNQQEHKKTFFIAQPR